MKRERKCDKVKEDEWRREVVISLSFNSRRSLTRVALTCPKLLNRQAPEERGGECFQEC
jgi:hypothetical protein